MINERIFLKPWNRTYEEFVDKATAEGRTNVVQDEKAFYALYPWEMVQDGEIVDISETAEYKEKLAKDCEASFKAEFIELSIGCFRKQPKGYKTAVEAFSRIDIKVAAFNGLNEQLAALVTFYKKPDFADPEACTEEAITKTAFNPKPMTAQEWALISLEFDTKWAQEEHKNAS